MSYSFSVKAKDKHDAEAQIANKLRLINASQPHHVKDSECVQRAIRGLTGLLHEDPACDITLNVGGSIVVDSSGLTRYIDLNVSASLTKRESAAAAASEDASHETAHVNAADPDRLHARDASEQAAEDDSV